MTPDGVSVTVNLEKFRTTLNLLSHLPSRESIIAPWQIYSDVWERVDKTLKECIIKVNNCRSVILAPDRFCATPAPAFCVNLSFFRGVCLSKLARPAVLISRYSSSQALFRTQVVSIELLTALGVSQSIKEKRARGVDMLMAYSGAHTIL